MNKSKPFSSVSLYLPVPFKETNSNVALRDRNIQRKSLEDRIDRLALDVKAEIAKIEKIEDSKIIPVEDVSVR